MVVCKLTSFSAANNGCYLEEQQEQSLFRDAITEGWATIIPGIAETDEVVASGYFECEP
jgi:hypothetical protein